MWNCLLFWLGQPTNDLLAWLEEEEGRNILLLMLMVAKAWSGHFVLLEC